MIRLTFTAKQKGNDSWFRQRVYLTENDEFDFKKEYTCEIVNSNLGTNGQPEFLGFGSDNVNGLVRDYVELKINQRCNNARLTVAFHTETEVAQKKKFEYLKWLSGFFTWFDFIFRIFSLKTLKKVTKVIATIIAIPILAGMLFATTEFIYESIYDENFEDSYFVQEVWNKFTVPNIGRYFREDAGEDLKKLGVFMKDKAEDTVDKTKEIAEDTKEKVIDLKDGVVDKIEDVTD